MMRLSPFVVALCCVLPVMAQEQSALVELASRGQVDEAWRQWRALPASAERSRTGVALAAATGDITQGLTIYDELTRQLGQPDHAALDQLAVAAARSLAAARDHDTQVSACAVVLQADSTHQPCWDVARAVQADSANPRRQAFDVLRMADAGFRPWPGLVEESRDRLSAAERVDAALEFTRLPAAERAALAAPGLQSGDAAVRQRAASVLGDIEGPEAMSVLRNAFDGTEDFSTRVNLAVPLARHGDAEAAELLRRVPLIGPAAIEANLALSAAGDRSAMPPQVLLRSAPPAARGRVIMALAAQDRVAAEAAVVEMMRDSNAAVRDAGFRAAALMGLGDQRVVYSQLAQSDPGIRIAAVLAVHHAVSEVSGTAIRRLAVVF